MDHTTNQPSPATVDYQPIPDQETQDHGEEENDQAVLEAQATNEPDTSENENARPNDGELPQIQPHGFDLATILGDIATIASPIAIIVFAILVLCLDGSEASEASFAKWNNATTVVCGPFNE